MSEAAISVSSMAFRGFARDVDHRQTQIPTLDASQRAVLELPDSASAAVIGAPGTGKTTTIIELVADRVLDRGWSPDELVVLTPQRTSATRLRDALAVRLGVPTNGPLARTVNSLAFDLVRHAARAEGSTPPSLLTGGDQDQLIKDLLAGHIEDGAGPRWPDLLGDDVRSLRAFRTELRELLMRATEYGVSTDQMRQLAAAHDRQEWAAAADFADEYFTVLGAARDNFVDAAELLAFATAALRRADVAPSAAELRLVIIDDLQEATESTIALLRGLVARGVAVIAFGDPDVATNAFRGGEPDTLGRFAAVLGVPDAPTLYLGAAHRQPTALRALTRSVTERIGTAAAGRQRAAVAASVVAATTPILLIEEPTPSREAAAIARVLREQHLLNQVPFSQMAVIVRSGALIPSLARSLALAEVPTRTLAGGQALRDDHAARSLLAVVDVGIGRTELDPAVAVGLLQGPFCGLDRLALRRLRLALRAEELAGDGNRSSDELLVEALGAPGRFATIDHRIGRTAEKLATTLAKVSNLAASGGSIEELLWLVWERSGLADSWQSIALSAGIGAAEANRNLDGIMAVFAAARRFVERRPDAAPRSFLEALLDAEVPEDTLAPQQGTDAVLVTTPTGAVGTEFETVLIAGLQDGVWPNLRIRGSLLYPQQLVDAVTGLDSGTVDARKQVVSDELRMFALAVSRARRQVVLSAVVNEDAAQSMFWSLIPGHATLPRLTTRPPLSLRGLTGRLRRDLVTAHSTDRSRRAAASALARLADESVPGADPAEWHGLLEPSTLEPLYAEDEQVPVSPSKLEAFEDSPLDWFLDSVAGGGSNVAMGIGTVLHWAMETATDPRVDELWKAVESRWNELLFESPWLADSQKNAARLLVAGIAEYLADFTRDGKNLVTAEGRFTVDLGRAQLNGSIDRVERAADGSVVIVDLKTGTPITSQPKIDEHPQLLAYQLAYADGHFDDLLEQHGEHRSGGAKLLYVKKGVRGKLYREGAQAPITDEQLAAFRERVRQAAIGMAAAQYTGELEIDQWGKGNTASMRLHRVKAVSSD